MSEALPFGVGAQLLMEAAPRAAGMLTPVPAQSGPCRDRRSEPDGPCCVVSRPPMGGSLVAAAGGVPLGGVALGGFLSNCLRTLSWDNCQRRSKAPIALFSSSTMNPVNLQP
jgi:hypothetical protein